MTRNETGAGIIMSPKPLAFLSHSAQDTRDAQLLASDLRAHKIGVWIDTERVKYGHSIPKAIEEGLRIADAVLVLISEAFVRSRWCRAEYDAILVAEIETGRTLVIPVLVDTCEMPPLLQAKRHCDLRMHALSSEQRLKNFEDLVAQIRAQHHDRGMMPRSTDEYARRSLATRLKGELEMLDPETLTAQMRAGANVGAAIDLLEEVIRLVEHFETQYDDLAAILTETAYGSTIHGSWYRASRSRLLRVNRKLVTISNEMRSIALSITRRFSIDATMKGIIQSITNSCLQLSRIEDVLVVEAMESSGDVPFAFDEERRRIAGYGSQTLRTHRLTDYNDAEAGLAVVESCHELLIVLNDYKIALKEAVLDLEREAY